MNALDSRLHAYRADIADISLQGQVSALKFVESDLRQVIRPLVPVRKHPRADAMQVTQALLGETAKVFEDKTGWSWVQLDLDGYVGYVESSALGTQLETKTHRVAVPSTFLYPAPDLKSQPATRVSMNAEVSLIGGDSKFTQIASGQYIYTSHLRERDVPARDYVSVAEMFLHVPYYWGGKSVEGLDCSGLVQLSLQACGKTALRDSDMQEAMLGSELDPIHREDLKRGDLVFWTGHVGIMTDGKTLLHANGHHMMVVAEPLSHAAARIADRYGPITSIRRL